ncbi:MAG: MBOAT family protein [Lachnospiraceae bacterium]|jgi:D-alanyl-lipoteichoic acid acyltransferase DltB (MBOAT superfamily)|nr:MBOAT family protein [Lachnospiraceae bacterium]
MMSYTSFRFVLLVVAGLVLTNLVPKRLRGWVLLVLSLIFMVSAGGYQTVCFWLISTAAGFAAGLLLCGDKSFGKGFVLFAAVMFQLGLLAYFKYANLPFYTLEAWGEITGQPYEFEPVERASILGISFYTLMIIGYNVDVYRKDVEAARSLLDFSLFTGYFGHIVQGPVDTYKETGESLKSPSLVAFEDLQAGCLKILLGLFKKLMISERLSVIVDTIYGDYSSYGGWYLFLAAVSFSMQLYTDFSGCMDIVTGVSRLFGIHLAENFRQPYFSETIGEFWRRWHITLGAFLRKYVYIPLGGNRRGKLCKYMNITVVFFLSGLWHGGKYTFIIGTGLLQCGYMIFGELLKPLSDQLYRLLLVDPNAPAIRVLRRVRTFLLVTAGFVLFRSDSLIMAGRIFAGMFGPARYAEYGEGVFYSGLGMADFVILLISLTILFVISLWREKNGDRPIVQKEGKRTVLCFGIAFVILLFGCYGKGYDMSSFIYSQF